MMAFPGHIRNYLASFTERFADRPAFVIFDPIERLYDYVADFRIPGNSGTRAFPWAPSNVWPVGASSPF